MIGYYQCYTTNICHNHQDLSNPKRVSMLCDAEWGKLSSLENGTDSDKKVRFCLDSKEIASLTVHTSC